MILVYRFTDPDPPIETIYCPVCGTCHVPPECDDAIPYDYAAPFRGLNPQEPPHVNRNP